MHLFASSRPDLYQGYTGTETTKGVLLDVNGTPVKEKPAAQFIAEQTRIAEAMETPYSQAQLDAGLSE